MSLSSLQPLKAHRNDLLLAEAAALLHDMGKLCDAHIKHTCGAKQWDNDDGYKAIVDDPASLIQLSPAAVTIKKPAILNNLLRKSQKTVAEFIPQNTKDILSKKRVNLLGEDYSLAELMMLGMPGFATHQHRDKLLKDKDGWLPALLGVCHNEAHVDKEEPKGGSQTLPDILTSNAFGFEQQIFVLGDPRQSLDARLSSLIFQTSLTERATCEQIVKAFEDGLGDTRRPINEVTLADWSEIVASLFKSALAGAILKESKPKVGNWKSWEDKIIDHDLRWRLLSVNFDVLGLYAKAIKIGDLLGYQEVVEKACQTVKSLIEEEYPLGNEIYRDTTGIYFTFPDWDLPDDQKQEIRRRVEQVEMELAPRIAVTSGDGETAAEQLKSLLKKARQEASRTLAHPFETNHLASWQQYWNEKEQTGKWEVCPVCRLRPKHEDREVCQTCQERRQGRIKKWLEDPSQTIWTNEVADQNGRLALVVGKFGLDDWLSGDLVQTLLVRCNPRGGVFAPKNPSPARLRRIWRTTQRFWESALDEKDQNGNALLAPAPKRLVLSGELTDPSASLDRAQVYELSVAGCRLSVVWDGQQFIVCDNPAYFKTLTGKDLGEVLLPGASFQLTTSRGYGKKDEPIGAFTINKVGEQSSYTPVIPILAEPRSFLALVPADRALEIVQAIYKKHQREMGKVRDRLPLHLGILFAERRTPLQALLEAARGMLSYQAQPTEWVVKSITPPGQGNADSKSDLILELERGSRRIIWRIPLKMGDGVTDDEWYPYLFLKTSGDDAPAGAPKRRAFTAPFPTGDCQKNKKWVVHAADLQTEDAVYLWQSTFDFEFLDAASRRFEIDYANGGRRPRRTRPFGLEDLQRLEDLWQKDFCQLKRSQFTQVLQIIEAARQRWRLAEGEEASANVVFTQFVSDTLANAAWPKAHTWKDLSAERQCQLIQAAVHGELADWAELHLEILKEKMKGEPS